MWGNKNKEAFIFLFQCFFIVKNSHTLPKIDLWTVLWGMNKKYVDCYRYLEDSKMYMTKITMRIALVYVHR